MIATWVTNDGRELLINTMSTPHIQNCIYTLQSGKIKREYCNNMSQREWVLIFKTELTRRSRFN